MRVRLLGPIDVVVGGVVRPVQGLRRVAILAALALQPGEIVSVKRLVDIVWGDTPPAATGPTLQSHVSHLRRALGNQSAILARPPGYLLRVDDEPTDVQSAERLIAQGTASADPSRSADALRAAVALWRGPALAELAGLPWFDAQAQRLEDLFEQARDGLIDARLSLGQHAQLIGELETLVDEQPHRESTYGRLMLALYRSGRQGDALAMYQRLRRVLDADLGIVPSQPLRDLEAAILRQDQALGTPPPPVRAADRSAAPPVAVPAQLPPVVASFTGRAGELVQLDGILSRAHNRKHPTAVVVTAVSGTAGIGKTTLAVHWAQRNAAQFPDGQLYVNLRGFDPGGSALEPAEAIADFLDAFGITEDRIPAGLSARLGLYRSLMAGKRVLVVLDNARDAAQVRPLLPGSPGCLAVVTSRDKLAPLVATEGAHPITLDLLTHAEAHDLLAQRLGADRVGKERQAVDDIIVRCARLPLALAIAAARAATQPELPLAALAAELAQVTDNLDALRGGDLATDVRAVFSWSYQTLSVDAARLFRLLGLHPGPDISAAAAASLAAVTPQHVGRLLGELTRAHLLNEHIPGRYAFHDLLRAYATEQAHAHDDDKRAARLRMLEHYLRSAHTAALSLYPSWDRIAFDEPTPGVLPESPTGDDGALNWFSAEYQVLGAMIEQTAAQRVAEFDRLVWQLTWAFTTFLLRRGYRDEPAALQRMGLEAARRVGDAIGEGCILRGLGLGHARWGRHDEAGTYFRQALQVYEGLGDHSGQAHAYTGLADAVDKAGQPAEALEHILQALELFRAAGNDPGYAVALNNAGYCYGQLGDHQQAVAYCTRALRLLQQLGDRDGEAGTWDSLGHAYHDLTDYARAIVSFQHAIDLYRDLGDRYYEADTLSSLGDTHRAAGDLDAANKAWRHALDILDELNHPDADTVRGKLETPANG